MDEGISEKGHETNKEADKIQLITVHTIAGMSPCGLLQQMV
jgi:hypothetical protein